MDNFEKGKVSICIPTYNGSKYILTTLNSVLNQDYKNLEIIVNDDCSSDNTLELVKTLKDDRIRIYKNEKNCGLVGNWNATVSYATGEFSKLMCQDDVLCPGAISAQVRLMRDNPSASLSIGNTYVIDSEGGVIMKRHRFGKDMIINGKSYARKSFYGRNIYSEPPNALYYTKDFYKIGKYDSSLTYTPDWDFTARLSYLGDICCSEAYIMQFRISDSSETSRIYSKRLASSIKDSDMLIDKHKKMRCIRISFFGAAFFKLVIRIAAVARLLVLSRKKSIKQ